MKHTVKLKDSNCALIGSSLDLEARVKAARTEKEWIGAGKDVGIQVWRVEKFNIKKWKKSRVGEFYDGDSFIILRTYKENNKLKWNVHFWLGSNSSIDERGVAAYKTVELDDLLGTTPVQYREVQGYESPLFMSYFDNQSITIMTGGIESGFRHVEPEKYIPKLFHIKGKRRVQVIEVTKSCSSLNYGDAFVLDHGLEVYVWIPKKAGATEMFRARMLGSKIKEQRKGVTVFDLDEDGCDVKGNVCEAFWKALGGKGVIKAPNEVEIDEVFDKMGKEAVRCMFELSENSKGNLEFKKVSERKLDKNLLKSGHCFLLDVGNEVLIWCGKKVPKKVKNNSIRWAQNYLGLHNKEPWVPIGRVCEGRETKRFWDLFRSQATGSGESILQSKKTFPERSIDLTIVSCSELMKKDTFGKSDPYVVVGCGASEKMTSKLIKRSLNPMFNEKMTLKFNSNPDTTCLKIRVFDNDKLSRDDKLGKVDIPLSCLPKDKEIVRTFKLQKAKTGEIKLKIKALDFGVVKSERPTPILMPTLLVNLDSAYLHQPINDGPKKQPKPFSPYVELSVGDTKFTSEVVKGNNRPKFKDMFAFRLKKKNPDEEILCIKVRTDNPWLIVNPQLGKMMMPIALLPYGKTVTRKIPLFKKNMETEHYLEMTFRLVSLSKKSTVMDFY